MCSVLAVSWNCSDCIYIRICSHEAKCLLKSIPPVPNWRNTRNLSRLEIYTCMDISHMHNSRSCLGCLLQVIMGKWLLLRIVILHLEKSEADLWQFIMDKTWVHRCMRNTIIGYTSCRMDYTVSKLGGGERGAEKVEGPLYIHHWNLCSYMVLCYIWFNCQEQCNTISHTRNKIIVCG